MEADFSGWATVAGVRCADGRTITPHAFQHMDKMTVPLVWMHGHDKPTNVLGHAVLEVRPEGVYAHGYFNDTDWGRASKALVQHGDVKSLSIWANQLKEHAGNVLHGVIRELSLVLSGANPKARIEQVRIAHSADPTDFTELEDEAIIHVGTEQVQLTWDDDSLEHAEGDTAQDVYDSLNEQQRNLLHYMISTALEQQAAEHSGTNNNPAEGENLEHQNGANGTMTANVFDRNKQQAAGGGLPTNPLSGTVLSHSDLRDIARATFSEGGTFKKALAAKLTERGVTEEHLAHGIENIDLLFPDARNLTNTPQWISRRMEWVTKVINGTSKTPFSRVKTMWADITADEARARGYVKGNYKKEEWFDVKKRTTGPTTVYKKQKLDRDDIIDVEDFDLVAWMRAEMRVMIEEELARAILIGDGRAVDDEDKIKDPAAAVDGMGIRSILNEHEYFAVQVNVNIADSNSSYLEVIEEIILNRRFYKGSGNPTLFTTEEHLARMLLLKDEANSNRRLFNTVADLAAYLRVDEIVPVEVMETVEGTLFGIMVNLKDYNIGASKGGELTNFDDFDIDYNQYKYLIETRLSGALTVPFSAMVIRLTTVANLVKPTVPTFNKTTGVVTIVATTGVVYKDGEGNTLSAGAQTALDPGESLTVVATPASTYYFRNNQVDGPWVFKRPAA